jgi:hypothetical protein
MPERRAYPELEAVQPRFAALIDAYHAIDQVCAEGEDACHTRREVVLTPIPRLIDAACRPSPRPETLPNHVAGPRSQAKVHVSASRDPTGAICL